MWRIRRRVPARVSDRQRQFPFRERSERLDRFFRRGIAATTLLVLVGLVGLTPTGRDALRRAASGTLRTGWAALGVPPSRDVIDADWAGRRRRDVASASATFRQVYDESSPSVQRLLRFAGMDRETALLRWGNYDKILVLPSAVFAPASCSRSTPMICSSVNLNRFIVRPLVGPDSSCTWRSFRGSRHSPWAK